MDKDKRRAQVREAKRTYRQKMRAAGFWEIIVWATPAQAEIIKELVKGNVHIPRSPRADSDGDAT